MRSAFTWVGALGAALALLSTAGCAAEASDDPTSLVIAVGPVDFAMDYNVLGTGYSGFYLTQAVYEPLIRVGEDGRTYEPVLAESYEISDDRRSMTLHLRTNVDFIDGEHLDAAGVKKVLDVFLANPEAGRGIGTLLATEWGLRVTATGEDTIEFECSSAIGPEFLSFLSLISIVSPVAIDDPDSLASKPVGTGPYLIDEVVPDVSVSYVRNADYWNPAAYEFDTLEIRLFEDTVAAFNALKSGQVDVTGITPDLAADAEAAGFAVSTTAAGFDKISVLDRTGQIVPALADARVRQAMSLAFDRPAIVEALYNGFGEPSSQPFGRSQEFYVEGGDDRYGFDVATAKQLLADAGYPDGFEATILTFVDAAQFQPIVENSLADIGITVRFEVVNDYAALADALRSFEYPLVLQHFGYVNAVRAYVNDAAGFLNFAGIADPTFDRLHEIVTNGTVEEADEAARELGEYMLDEAWHIVLGHPAGIMATSPDIDVAVRDDHVDLSGITVAK